ncbi:MAG: ribonuclease III [Alistipes sp.]|nr:ribonuclease III [Alistipes sp.]
MFGFIPNNIELYKLALIHKSASVVLENGQHINNERLEFLGDAVLESVSSDYLFIEFPDKNEGFLTQLRSKMVSRQTLNEVAKRIGLDDYVITHSSNNLSQKHIYGDAFEAMMGAIYLDQGYDFVNRLLINKIFVDYIKVGSLLESETDFKSRLIEWCQKNHHTIYFATSHDKTYSSTHPFFYSKVLIDNMEVGYGAGDSKKEAEQRAAHSVSQGLNDDDCAKLLDKLDNIDALHNRNRKVEQKPHPQPKPQPKPQSEPKPQPKQKAVEQKAVEQRVAEPNDEPVAKVTPKQDVQTEEKPAEPTKQPSRRRRAAKPTMADAEKSAEKSAEKPGDKPQEQPVENITVKEEPVVADVKQAEDKSAQTKPQKPAAKRAPRRKPAPKSESGAETDKLEADKPKANKSKAQRGATAKKSTADNEQKELF